MNKTETICYRVGCGLSTFMKYKYGRAIENLTETLIIETFQTWDKIMRTIRSHAEKFIEGLRKDN